MKKKLLKPPQNNNELFFLPEPKQFITLLKQESKIGLCHQPYFFNPGISLKFIFLENLSVGMKQIIFLDIDKVNIQVKIPCLGGGIKIAQFINTDLVLSDYPTPEKSIFYNFFSSLQNDINKISSKYSLDIISNFLTLKDIILNNISKRFLKEVLAESFLQFYNIKRDYYFLSEIIHSKEFKDFFLRIYKDDHFFREVFNRALDEYKKTFRFRFKNFPFPKLKEDELPFWIVKNQKRIRCFKNDLDMTDIDKLIIFPRAATLTIFLRLYKLDFFIHGIGAANYEWVQDRIMESFFKKAAPPFMVTSGTFLIDNFTEREFPYFFFNPVKITDRLQSVMKEDVNV